MRTTDRLYLFTSINSDELTNSIRYESLFNSLAATGRGPVRVKGKYSGIREPSIGVIADNNFEPIVADICRMHNQECFMVVYLSQRGLCELVYPDGSRKNIGSLYRVSQAEANAADGYTEFAGEYYVVK